jgi:hypothetical protein
LVPVDPADLTAPRDALNDAGNWRASTHVGGSPGADDPNAEVVSMDRTVTVPGFARWQ